MTWSRRTFLACFGVSLAQLAACRPQTPDHPDDADVNLTLPDTIRIGILAPLTGPHAAADGLPLVQAAELVVNEVHRAGGIEIYGEKRPLELRLADELDRPDHAVAAARRLMFQDQVIAIVGLPLSFTAIPVANFTEMIPIPTISTTSTHPDTTANKNYVFRAGFIDDVQGRVLAEFAYGDLGARRAALLYDIASVYNQGLAETFAAAFTAFGGEIVHRETYTTQADPDFRPALAQIRDRTPDLLFLPNYINDIRRQTAQARDLGITATFLGGDAWDSIQTQPDPSLDGSYFATHWYANPDDPKIRAFITAYREAYRVPPNLSAALAYDAMHLLLEAIRSQGRTDAQAIQAGLQSIRNFDGVSGTIRFRGTGDPIKTVVIVQIDGDRLTIAQTITPSL
ncbi:ABC transporter substrate-binding protein [Spirulina major CS-329]|uniref:ABC transporter substrate-binding protein n=1 Tax=Spirulina TaxID=1154 RepID=UPI00232FB83D|nr:MULTISPECIES: ABC transporter substrate-binding protein [Spirulina]MDB9495662.1 ABC transporter substrate-binding protein [Spirulina subsalsa CS-330]MDB9501486.1 ABC transporter substrate-binding protein [Spirulina major CS-329]